MRTLMVAASGGHLMELYVLRDRLVPPSDHVTWVTFDNDQTRSLLVGEDVVTVRPVAPRDLSSVAINAGHARRILRDAHVDQVISTGAAVALAFLPLARLQGRHSHYIESAARTDGPSMTGRLLDASRTASLYSQYPEWADAHWRYRGTVFQGFESVRRDSRSPIRRVLVTVGTMRFPFSRLLHRLKSVLPPDAEVVWQLGDTPDEGLGGTVVATLSHQELAAQMAAADVVVCHAGVGSALTALSVGHCPVLVPRQASRGEHVDEHQVQIARALAARGLAIAATADSLDMGHLAQASGLATRTLSRPPAFVLDQATEPRWRRRGVAPGSAKGQHTVP